MVKHRTIQFICSSGLCLAVVLSSGSVLGVSQDVLEVTTPILVSQEESGANATTSAIEECNISTSKPLDSGFCKLEIYDTSIKLSIASLKDFVENDYIPQLDSFEKSVDGSDASPENSEPEKIELELIEVAFTALAEIENHSAQSTDILTQLPLEEGAQIETKDSLTETLKNIQKYSEHIQRLINPLEENGGVIDEVLIKEIQGLVNPTKSDGGDNGKTLAANADTTEVVVGEYGGITQRAVESLLESRIDFLDSYSNRFEAELSDLKKALSPNDSKLGQLWKILAGLLSLLILGAAFMRARLLSRKSGQPKKKRNFSEDVRAVITQYIEQSPPDFMKSVLAITQNHYPAISKLSSQSSIQTPQTVDQADIIGSLIQSEGLRQLIQQEVDRALKKNLALYESHFHLSGKSGHNQPTSPKSGSLASPYPTVVSHHSTIQLGSQADSRPQSSIINRYNNGQLNRHQAKEVVSPSAASQEAFRLAKGELPTLVPDISHGNYWILSEGAQHYLVPKYKARFNESSLQSLANLYEYPQPPNLGCPVRVIEPAIVMAAGSEGWKLKSRGKLSFG